MSPDANRLLDRMVAAAVTDPPPLPDRTRQRLQHLLAGRTRHHQTAPQTRIRTAA